MTQGQGALFPQAILLTRAEQFGRSARCTGRGVRVNGLPAPFGHFLTRILILKADARFEEYAEDLPCCP